MKTQRFSMLAGKMVDVPEKRESAKQGGAESVAIGELLTLLEQTEERVDAAQTVMAEMSSRITRLEDQLMQALNKPAQQIPASVVNVPASVPATYKATVTKHDVHGRVEEIMLRPVPVK